MAQVVAMFLLFFLWFVPAIAAGGFRSRPATPSQKPSRPPSIAKDLDKIPTPTKNNGLAGLQAQLLYTGFDDAVYVLQVGVGTPASNVSLIIDTSDDFIWSDCLQTSASAYYPNKSSTFITPPCDNPRWEAQLEVETCDQLPQCRYNCSGVVGVLANDTFNFGGSTPRNLSFACNDVVIYNYSDSSGYVGVGRGPLSLISQLKFSKFSHCFIDQIDGTSLSSYMFFGSYADLDSTIAVNTTSIANDSIGYILDLRGISVGAKRLPILPEMLQYVQNSNGTVIYSTDPFTYLPTEAYNILREEVIAQVGLPLYNNSLDNIGIDLCFDWTSDRPLNLSTVTFHFDGADMTLPTPNFLANYTDDNDTSLVCFMMVPYDDGYSYLGNYRMQNFQYIYDLENGKLSFRNVQCDKLQPHKSHAVKLDLHSIALAVLLILYLLVA